MKTFLDVAIPKKLFLAFMALVVVAVVVSAISLTQLHRIKATNSWTVHTLNVIETAGNIRSAMVDQQSGLRGYFEGRRTEFLEPYRNGRSQMEDSMSELRSLTVDNPDQQSRIAVLSERIARWYEDYGNIRLTLAEQGTAPEDGPLALVGKQRMDGIRAAIADIVSDERRLLAERKAQEEQAFRTAYWATALGGLVLLLVAFGSWAALRRGVALPIRTLTDLMMRLSEDEVQMQIPWREQRDEVGAMARAVEVFRRNAEIRMELERRKAETDERIRASEAQLRSIFDSVREGVLTCDMQGNIKTANGAAARLFGLARLEGRSIGTLMADPDNQDQPLMPEVWHPDEAVDTVETIGHHAEGRKLPLEASITRAHDTLTMTVRDISARKEVDRMKNEFVSTVSHELRTPLTSIRGALGLVLGIGLGLPEKTLSLLQIAHRNAERLISLVNDILDIEKIQSGNMEFAFARMDLFDAVRDAVEANRTYAGQRQVHLELAASMDRVTVLADNQRIQQVLANLLSNAVKFSDEGGTVTVRLAVERGERQPSVRVSVHDTGPGVPEEFRGRIFQKFAQADAADTRAKGGTGLGLSITKAIVERHGGEVGFRSEPGDTTFHVLLPLAQEEAPPRPAPADSSPTASDVRLLICEDDLDIARLLRFMVQRQGIDADLVHTAAAARAALENGGYTALTLDLNLPDESGLDLFRDLRRDPRFHDLPVVIISATASQGSKDLNGEAVGIIDWMEKPIDEKRLARVLGGVIARGSVLPSILYVEDDPDLLVLVERLLAESAVVVGVPDLASARTALERRHFDLVILDIGLGADSGVELLPDIARLEPAPKVLVFSAQQIGTDLAQRVSGVLVKSRTTNEELVQRILDIVALSRQKASSDKASSDHD